MKKFDLRDIFTSRDSHPNAEGTKNLEKRKRQLIADLAVSSRISGVDSSITADDLDTPFDSMEFIKRNKWSKKYPKAYHNLKLCMGGGYIAARSGTGKTQCMFAKILAYGADEKYRSIKYATWSAILDAMNEKELREHVLGKIIGAEVLIIEDVGSDVFHQKFVEEPILLKILDSRINRKTTNGRDKITWITSTKTIENLRFSERIKNRLSRVGPIFVIEPESNEVPSEGVDWSKIP